MAIFEQSIHWPVWLMVLPLTGALLTFAIYRYQNLIGLITAMGILWSVIALAQKVLTEGPQRYSIGGWGAPLGIDLYVDGLSTLMLLLTAAVGFFVSFYGVGYAGFRQHNHGSGYFWPLWLFLWTALNGLFLTADIFNAYVTLELIGLASVALVGLSGQASALNAAMRYLLVGLLGSLFYLLGVGLLYAGYHTVDMASLGQAAQAGPLPRTALTLMGVGLLLKTALFPLHFWLPPAHANAPTPVSSALSALVVKAPFYLLLRLWFTVFPDSTTGAAANLLGLLGAIAILWGSIQALQTQRLKLLVAYSTVAQLGYLFLVFPLTQDSMAASTAWSGALYYTLAHGLAKGGMFLAAGTIFYALQQDRIQNLNGISRHLPVTAFAFGLAGVSLMGLPPSAGFLAKWSLLTAAIANGQWGWAIIIVLGGLLAAGYVFRVLSYVFMQAPSKAHYRPVPWLMEWPALLLALMAICLGFITQTPLTLIEIGAPMSYQYLLP
ncbi:multisubunit sodium/proton antiporter, MrpD subunit [Nitrosococcus oceani ATCC 19707]|uniref:Multisubunit sodium/proton antiporter, MrpD subunit n=2 Tax=Nitrosococcus oceani TaxID=1229 RepID=Q3JBL5_NITOC|nr:proton-conducting transporter membrane subunit [Nitrosococcus oceani]ABA57781.1 multisubunit sodium/proton antiporter, MrpD subunit [Nitrosococcus oceani ATCC 19707]EDZ68119.1 NADH-Ubiquinone/plastoquinone (complex I), domain protein [Nitrosococcus oceani AFC27]KFI19798.1 oxidoreductase [Nitrosococcus oceani C-27]